MRSTSFDTEQIEMAKPSTGRKKPDPNETKEAKFMRLATLKVGRLIKAVDQLGNLSRMNPTQTQREYIFDKLKEHLEAAYARWSGEKPVGEFQIPTK